MQIEFKIKIFLMSVENFPSSWKKQIGIYQQYHLSRIYDNIFNSKKNKLRNENPKEKES